MLSIQRKPCSQRSHTLTLFGTPGFHSLWGVHDFIHSLCSKCRFIDVVGKYILPSNHSVLNDRCQFGCHGEACERMGVRDCSRHHMFRWGPLIALRSAAHLKTRQMGSPRGSIGIRFGNVSEDRRVLRCEGR